MSKYNEPRKPKKKNGDYMDEDKARRCIAFVVRGRQLLAERVRSVTLFGPRANQAKKRDHPMVQVLYQIRDKYLQIAQHDGPDAVELQVTTLTKMFQFAKDLTQEGNKASVEVQAMLQSRVEMQQRIKEHEDKMALAKKLKGADVFTDEELQAAAGDTGSKVIPWGEKPAEPLPRVPEQANPLGPLNVAEGE